MQKSAIIEAHERQDGREVSPLTWKDGEYQFSITWQQDDADEAGEDDGYQAQLAQAQRLDLNDIVARVCERLAETVLRKRKVEIAEGKYLDKQTVPRCTFHELSGFYMAWAHANHRGSASTKSRIAQLKTEFGPY